MQPQITSLLFEFLIMKYLADQDLYIQKNGYEFQPCSTENYKTFLWMISIFDGNIYYTSNDSDKALSAIIKKLHEHDPTFTWMGESDFVPYSDEYLYSLIPDEVNEELGWKIFPTESPYMISSWFKTFRFDTKEDAPKTWKWVKEEGIKIRHFKSPRCVKENSFLSC